MFGVICELQKQSSMRESSVSMEPMADFLQLLRCQYWSGRPAVRLL